MLYAIPCYIKPPHIDWMDCTTLERLYLAQIANEKIFLISTNICRNYCEEILLCMTQRKWYFTARAFYRVPHIIKKYALDLTRLEANLRIEPFVDRFYLGNWVHASTVKRGTWYLQKVAINNLLHVFVVISRWCYPIHLAGLTSFSNVQNQYVYFCNDSEIW